MKEIQDEFTHRKDISRQRKYQLRNKKEGKCIRCGLPLKTKDYCDICRVKRNAESVKLANEKIAKTN